MSCKQIVKEVSRILEMVEDIHDESNCNRARSPCCRRNLIKTENPRIIQCEYCGKHYQVQEV